MGCGASSSTQTGGLYIYLIDICFELRYSFSYHYFTPKPLGDNTRLHHVFSKTNEKAGLPCDLNNVVLNII